MRDQEGHELFLSNKPNQHLLIWGQSGQGKTFCCCRLMEEMMQENKKILLLDYSGSFTTEELVKNQFKYLDRIKFFSLQEKPFYWLTQLDDITILKEDLKDALISILEVGSYYQKKMFRVAMYKFFEEFKYWSIPRFLEVVERMMIQKRSEESAQDDAKNLERILSRLAPFDSLNHFFIGIEPQNVHKVEPLLTIIQISFLPEQQRRFVMMLLSDLIWKETQRKQAEKRCDVMIFDEFQKISVKPDSSLSQILREGRKYDIAAILSSQFISAYTQEEISTLMQAGNVLIFKPTENDIRFSAKVIAPQEPQIWQKVLSNLKVGQAVLKGHYQLRPEGKILHTPIVCEIS